MRECGGCVAVSTRHLPLAKIVVCQNRSRVEKKEDKQEYMRRKDPVATLKHRYSRASEHAESYPFPSPFLIPPSPTSLLLSSRLSLLLSSLPSRQPCPRARQNVVCRRKIGVESLFGQAWDVLNIQSH